MSTPEDNETSVERTFHQGTNNPLAHELNAILAERRDRLENYGPMELLEHIATEASTIPGRGAGEGDVIMAEPTGSTISQFQQAMMSRLSEKGYGEFASLPDAVSALGARLVRTGTIDDLEINAADEAAYVSMVALASLPEQDPDNPEPFRTERLPKRKTETNEYAAL